MSDYGIGFRAHLKCLSNPQLNGKYLHRLTRDKQKIWLQLGISAILGYFWPKIGLGVESFPELWSRLGFGLQNTKNVVDVGVGVVISKKIRLWLGLGIFWLQNCGVVLIVGGIKVKLNCG